jgi:hypothetical protein
MAFIIGLVPSRHTRPGCVRGTGRPEPAYRDQLSNNGELDDLCRELRAYGVAQRHRGHFGVPYGAMVAATDRLCAEPNWIAAHRGRPLPRTRRRPPVDRAAEPEPYLFALSEPLLDLAERYMGLPVRYFGVAVKREIANGVLEGTRHFHTDPEDENVLKTSCTSTMSMSGPARSNASSRRTPPKWEECEVPSWSGSCPPQTGSPALALASWLTFATRPAAFTGRRRRSPLIAARLRSLT